MEAVAEVRLSIIMDFIFTWLAVIYSLRNTDTITRIDSLATLLGQAVHSNAIQ